MNIGREKESLSVEAVGGGLETRSGPQDREIYSTLNLPGRLLHLSSDVPPEVSKTFGDSITVLHSKYNAGTTLSNEK